MTYFGVSKDSSTRAANTVDYAHHEIHGGSHYFVKGWTDVSGAATEVDFLWVTPDTAKWAHAQWSIAGEAEFTLELYEGVTTSDDGSAITIYNNNRNSANTPGVTAYSGPTITNTGTLIWSGKIGTGRNATAGRETSGEIVAKQNTKYLFRITKEAAGDGWLDYDFNWYEHTNAG